MSERVEFVIDIEFILAMLPLGLIVSICIVILNYRKHCKEAILSLPVK